MAILGYHEKEQDFGEDVQKYYCNTFGRDIFFYSVLDNKGSVNGNDKAMTKVKQELENAIGIIKPDIVVDIHCDNYLQMNYEIDDNQLPQIYVYNHGPKPDLFEQLAGDRIHIRENTLEFLEKIDFCIPQTTAVSLAIEASSERAPYWDCVMFTGQFLKKLKGFDHKLFNYQT